MELLQQGMKPFLFRQAMYIMCDAFSFFFFFSTPPYEYMFSVKSDSQNRFTLLSLRKVLTEYIRFTTVLLREDIKICV